MRKPGLVSITFRNKTPIEILTLMKKARLEAVEWGGDVHVPPKGGKAQEVLRMTRDHGIEVSSYGSYYRLGQGTDAFRYALDEAKALEAPVIRIWAGTAGSRETDADTAKRWMDELFADDAFAFRAGVNIALEYHPNTLTDERGSVLGIQKQILSANLNVKIYWQPRWDWTGEERIASVEEIGVILSHMHVFTWRHTEGRIDRLALSEGEDMWKGVLKRYTDGYALIEFVKDDSDEQLIEDANTLHGWLAPEGGKS